MGVTQINSQKIADGTVDTADLKDGAVTLAKLAALTTKGDLLSHTGAAHVRVPVGQDDLANAQVLVASTSVSSGVDWAFRSCVINSITSDSTAIASTAAETNFSNTNLTLPANFLTVTKMLRFRVCGLYSTTGTPTLTLRFKLGATTIVSSGAITTPSGASNQAFVFEGLIMCRTTGATGQMRGSGLTTISAGGGTPFRSGAATVATTGTLASAVSAQWSASSASNTITVELFSLEALN